ncbi:hypothetical protein Q3G72_032091 [Acer saccharum]|nr:hypothetical protein Q3G72_032091 [Acer saccharum]
MTSKFGSISHKLFRLNASWTSAVKIDVREFHVGLCLISEVYCNKSSLSAISGQFRGRVRFLGRVRFHFTWTWPWDLFAQPPALKADDIILICSDEKVFNGTDVSSLQWNRRRA